MCNDYGNHIPYSRYVEAFSHLKLPLLVQGNGPDLAPRDDIRIRDRRRPVTELQMQIGENPSLHLSQAVCFDLALRDPPR